MFSCKEPTFALCGRRWVRSKQLWCRRRLCAGAATAATAAGLWYIAALAKDFFVVGSLVQRIDDAGNEVHLLGYYVYFLLGQFYLPTGRQACLSPRVSCCVANNWLLAVVCTLSVRLMFIS
jgi:hypothetical protein